MPKKLSVRTRNRILLAASAALRKYGPDNVSIASIMREVGLTHGGFYSYFKSKDDLITQAVGHAFADMNALFAKRRIGQTPRRTLDRFITYYLSDKNSCAVKTGCPLSDLARDVARSRTEARKAFFIGYTKLCDELSQLFIELGYTRTNADESATSLLSEMSGALLLSRGVADVKVARMICSRSRRALRRRYCSTMHIEDGS